MKRRTVLWDCLIALLFAALGGCLLLAGRGMRTSGGVLTETAELPGGKAALYCPAEAAGPAEAEDEDGHVYIARPGGALILSGTLDGADLLAVELARRDVTVLLADRDTDAAAGFSGYFGDGSARALESGTLLCTFTGRDAMLRVIDWQGSCLGHFRELADDDLVYPGIRFCRIAAGCCFLLAAVQGGLAVRAARRRDKAES